jgi:hypothetical protein
MARTTATAGTTRPTRTPVSTRNILTVKGVEEGYVYRVVNDTGDRIAQFIDGGYELVKADTVRVGDKRVNSPTAEGSNAQVSVGKGEKAYVMRIRKEFYDEDQQAKQAKVNELEQTMKQKAAGVADYGAFDIRHGS